MGHYTYTLQKKAELIAEKLGIEALSVGQHNGLTIEYIWMFTGNWRKKNYYFVKSDWWMRFWTVSGKDAIFSADMSGMQDFVKILFDADEKFPDGKIFEWDYLDRFEFIISDHRGTRTFEMHGEAYGDLARLENAVLAVSDAARLANQVQELNNRSTDAGYIMDQLGLRLTEKSRHSKSESDTAHTGNRSELRLLFRDNEPFDYDYIWKSEMPGLTIIVIKTSAWIRAFCNIHNSRSIFKTCTVELPQQFTDPMAPLLQNTDMLTWHISGKHISGNRIDPYIFHYITPQKAKGLIAGHSDDDMILQLISANRDVLKTILMASVPDDAAGAFGLERLALGRQGNETVRYIRIVPYDSYHPPHIIVKTDCRTKMLTYDDRQQICDPVELKYWDDPLLSLLKKTDTFNESGAPHERVPYSFVSVITRDLYRDILVFNQRGMILPDSEKFNPAKDQAFRAADAARIMKKGLDKGLWEWDIIRWQGPGKFGLSGLFAGHHPDVFVEYLWVCRLGQIGTQTVMAVKTNRWIKAVYDVRQPTMSYEACPMCSDSKGKKSECSACMRTGRKIILPEPVELHSQSDTFYEIMKDIIQLPCIVSEQYETVEFFLVTPKETKVFFVPRSEDRTVRKLIEAADNVAREFLSRTKPEET